MEATPIHIFFDYIHVKCPWERLRTKFLNDFILPTPQTAIIELYNEPNDNYNLLSYVLLIFKYLYINPYTAKDVDLGFSSILCFLQFLGHLL